MFIGFRLLNDLIELNLIYNWIKFKSIKTNSLLYWLDNEFNMNDSIPNLRLTLTIYVI